MVDEGLAALAVLAAVQQTGRDEGACYQLAIRIGVIGGYCRKEFVEQRLELRGDLRQIGTVRQRARKVLV